MVTINGAGAGRWIQRPRVLAFVVVVLSWQREWR